MLIEYIARKRGNEMKEKFTENEIKEINKALLRSEEDIKNGRVIR